MNIETGYGPRKPDGHKPKSPLVHHSRKSRVVDSSRRTKSKSPSPVNNSNRFKKSDRKIIWLTGGKRKSRRHQRNKK